MSSAPISPAGSPILEMARRAAEYRATGRRIIELTLGEPDFAPPVHAVAVPLIVPCSTESGFRLSPGVPAAAMTDRTRWVVLNAPGNPSGATCGHDLEEGCRIIVATLDGLSA
ncbi:hypothetical protein [Streptomyces sp. NPDC088801]|uniref:hypothetical protein n=1 Tax=Streptomyces sp. NPDC088801 TaxID=3365903 RepID=UPI00382B82E2